MLVFCCGEMKSPRRNMPAAAKNFIIRIFVFYIGSAIAIGVICPSDDPGLGSGGSGAGSSPFVLGIKRAGISGLDSVINAAILTSAWSAANAFIYQSSRSLYSMSINGDAPKIFSRCTKKGVPYVAVIASSLFSFLAYLNVNSKSGEVFNWLINLVNTAAFISWISCAVVNHIFPPTQPPLFYFKRLIKLVLDLPAISKSVCGPGPKRGRPYLHIEISPALGFVLLHCRVHASLPHQRLRGFPAGLVVGFVFLECLHRHPDFPRALLRPQTDGRKIGCLVHSGRSG